MRFLFFNEWRFWGRFRHLTILNVMGDKKSVLITALNFTIELKFSEDI